MLGDGTALPLLLTEAGRRVTQKDYATQHDKAGKVAQPDDVVKLLWALAQTRDRRTVPVLCQLAEGAGAQSCDDAGDVAIRIPARSLLAHKVQAVSEFRLNVPRAHDPLWKGTMPALGAAVDVGTTTVAVDV